MPIHQITLMRKLYGAQNVLEKIVAALSYAGHLDQARRRAPCP